LAGLAVVVVVAVVPVFVAVVPVLLVVVAGAGVETLALLSPAFVTRKVTARTRTPNTAMIAGRGRSIRVVVGTVWVERSFHCVVGT
jgi:hypothetical protein